jgi:DNA invertase Pin-like site-specific DNA recombinase
LSKDPSKTDDRRRYEGLGVEAQRQAIDSHIARVGGRLVVEPLVEFESGRKNNRPQLIAAIQKCRLYGATLIVGRMDRLARNVAFVSALMESGIDFVACDFPQANRLTVHLLAAMAEHEAALISSRIKSALVRRSGATTRCVYPPRYRRAPSRGHYHPGRPRSGAQRTRRRHQFRGEMAP